MYRGTYAFAGVPTEIVTRHEYTHMRCAAYGCGGVPDISVELTPEDVRREREAFLAADPPESGHSEGFLEYQAALPLLAQRLIERDVLLFHASAVAVDGRAYLFTARSGTGKSTHVQYWREAFGERAVVINDDKPFLSVRDGTVMVWGSPWAGKHKRSANAAAPVEAVCLLERSRTPFIRPITPREAFPVLYRQTFLLNDRGNRARELRLLDELSKNVRLYRLGADMSREAALTAYAGMNRDTDK